MSPRAQVAFRARCGRLRQFAVCILLLAIGALILQVPVHASPAGHAIHQQQAAATASHCAKHHMPDDHDADTSTGCVNTDGNPNLAAAVLVAPPMVGSPVTGEVFTVVGRDPHDRLPEGILSVQIAGLHRTLNIGIPLVPGRARLGYVLFAPSRGIYTIWRRDAGPAA